MANKEHVEILYNDKDKWNRWREKNPDIVPDLCYAYLAHMDLYGVNLTKARLISAGLTDTNLIGANLTDAVFTEANLTRTTFFGTRLVRANFSRANLTGATLAGADVKGAIFDFASWPLWCGSFNVRGDDRLVSQLFRHLIEIDDSECSKEVQEEMSILRKMKLANKFCEYSDVQPYKKGY